MSEVKRASFAVEDMSEGSNLFDNVRATIVSGKFTKEAPDNYTAEGNPIFGVVNLEIAGEGPIDERRVSQSYSLGAQAGDNFTVSGDGDYLIPTKDEASIRKDCKFGTLAASLQNEGVSKTILQSFAWSALVGLEAQWKRVADKERNFGDDQRTKPGQQQKKKFPPSTLVVVKLYGMPGEKAVGKPQTGTTTPTTPAIEEDFDDVVFGYLVTVLNEAKTPVQRSQLTLKLSKAAMADKHPKRQDIARRGAEESFLVKMAETGILTYDGSAKPQIISIA